jgi:hypothetical protein
MRLENALDRLHAHAVRQPWLQLFAALNRGLLAFSFIPSGLTKVLGHRFTTLPTNTPVGYFFEAFFQAGAYYRFVGFVQLLSGLLLLFPSTAALGAALYFPIILNIFLITVTMQFQGTPLITGAMLLANLFLLCWDYDRWKALLPGFTAGPVPRASARHLGAGFTIALAATAVVGGLGAVGLLRSWLYGYSASTPTALVGLATMFCLVLGRFWYRRA